MKKLVLIRTLLISGAVCFLSCKNESIDHDLVIIPDLTEDYFSGITIDEFKRFSSLGANANNGEKIRIVPITDLGMNKSCEAEIPKAPYLLMGNDFERTDEVNAYFSKVDSFFGYFKSQKKSRKESVVYKVLVAELNRLSKSKLEKRSLIVNTDFMENSFINFYNPSILKEIKRNPEKIDISLLSKYPLSDLKGIDIYFVYLPVNRFDSQRFEILSEFYKQLFESYGASVHIVANL
jgi:hypothetical protein